MQNMIELLKTGTGDGLEDLSLMKMAAARMELYEETLQRIGFSLIKRKMVKNPLPPEKWLEEHQLPSIELLGAMEMAGQLAMNALKHKAFN